MTRLTEAWTWAAIVALALVTMLSRGFFLIGDKPWPLPGWLRELLKVAPLAALVAVVAPEVFMSQGQVLSSWQDARWPAALTGAAVYFWRRDILATILSGMAVLLVLRVGLGW